MLFIRIVIMEDFSMASWQKFICVKYQSLQVYKRMKVLAILDNKSKRYNRKKYVVKYKLYLLWTLLTFEFISWRIWMFLMIINFKKIWSKCKLAIYKIITKWYLIYLILGVLILLIKADIVLYIGLYLHRHCKKALT